MAWNSINLSVSYHQEGRNKQIYEIVEQIYFSVSLSLSDTNVVLFGKLLSVILFQSVHRKEAQVPFYGLWWIT